MLSLSFLFLVLTSISALCKSDYVSNHDIENDALSPNEYQYENEHEFQYSSSDACNTHLNCTSCTASSMFCHWCDSDSECHAKASIHGCVIGSSCTDPSPAPPPAPSYHDACNTHKNCTTCTLSSSLCHWCAFDEECHAMGSLYGCSHGVNCFNNDRCKRKVPEKIINSTSTRPWPWNGDDFDVMDRVGIVPLIAIGFLSLFGVCLSTVCFVTVRAVKSTYDDWMDLHQVDESRNNIEGLGTSITGNEILFRGSSEMKNDEDNDDDKDDDNDNGEDEENGEENSSNDNMSISPNASLLRETTKSLSYHPDIVFQRNEDIEQQNADSSFTSTPKTARRNNKNKKKKGNTKKQEKTKDVKHLPAEEQKEYDHEENYNLDDLTQPLLDDDDNQGNYYAEEDDDDNDEHLQQQQRTNVTAHPSANRIPPSRSIPVPSIGGSTTTNLRPSSRNNMKCCYNTCYISYILTLLSITFFTVFSIYYFPQEPTFNVCSDEFAWNSIIDSLTSLKVEASFEILSSIQNKNHISVMIDNLTGTFRHDGDDVGTFTMKSTTIEADSITDVLIVCTVKPDRWDALGLISDYYRGKLKFMIDVKGDVRMKGIQYSFPIGVKDMLVDVSNQNMQDRSLCQCPDWKDLYPTASPALSFEKAVMEPSVIMPRDHDDNRNGHVYIRREDDLQFDVAIAR